MAAHPPSRSSTNLEPPRKSVELQDPGARDLGMFSFPVHGHVERPIDCPTDSSADEEYFSDASEGRRRTSRPETPLRSTSPIPKTRVERVDDKPSHGETPGSPAYDQRRQDAVPDELEIVPEGRLSKRSSRSLLEPFTSPGGTVVPRTIVEKIDPSSPSHGDVPGTPAYEQRLADATPDVVLKALKAGEKPPKSSLFQDDSADEKKGSISTPIPETVVTRVDSDPAHGEVEGTTAFDMRREDATPDVVERKSEPMGKH